MNERDEVRRRILDAAAELLQSRGRDAVTTRAVSAAAGVQPPTIYRLFTDMAGLLDAVAADGFDAYLLRKYDLALTDDPVEDLRTGWDLHVEFGLEHPAHYLLMYVQPDPGRRSPAAEQASERLRMLVRRVAEAGRLAVGVEAGAATVHAAGRGAVLHLISAPPEEHDRGLSRRLREAAIGAVTGAAPPGPPDHAQRAAGLKAVLGGAEGLFTAGERALLGEFLDRLADAPPAG
ncbi:TetR/AcrR family transcriptional regulator [Streptomonospora wellingtoniae]|uniref:TetR/AcrR family transcriptional regulator n=1 Tax=Streptomonospora wellingtoniae TaxID=3075544 RepID=A0ABU2L0V0_9ACTN|nr:TetR/AcrR family transcriptional regulator [Streptomonospora sp. DSM 45055]MDT0305192.1 TetR/AcrR family transcriptional regulator [Streptomonospora sp. DSM 45055]